MTDISDSGLELYRAAERDWEYHDASVAFRSFAHWLEDNFVGLVAALKAARDELATYTEFAEQEFERLRGEAK